jgi:CubicO group peptidase (beta-lactamase class C family)
MSLGGVLKMALDRIDEFAAAEAENGRHPGLAVATTDRDGLLRVSIFGMADIAGGLPVQSETLFEIGSISKSFTAVLALQEHEAGRLDVQAPIETYLPWFRLATSLGPITAHHLMTHTAGLPEGSNAAPASSPLGLVSLLADTPAAWPPGERFSYSNSGYQVLGLLLEEITGRSIPDLLQERIFEPLGMTRSHGVIRNALRPLLATGYERAPDDRPWWRGRPIVPATWTESATADGSIACTVEDLATYARLILNRGNGPQGPLIGEDSFRRWAGGLVDAWPGVRYGYGLAVEQLDGRDAVNHLGGMIGYSSALFADVEAGVAAVVLMNEPNSLPSVAQYALRVLRAASSGQQLPPPPVLRWSRVAKVADYAGRYVGPDGGDTFVIASEANGLYLEDGAGQADLEPLGGDGFLPLRSDLDASPLVFERDGTHVTWVAHGSRWLTREGHAPPAVSPAPPEWASYAGLYRANNPWRTSLRVIYRRGTLWLLDEPLVPLDDGSFRPEALPADRLSFPTYVGGVPVRATLSGCHYYRVDRALAI